MRQKVSKSTRAELVSLSKEEYKSASYKRKIEIMRQLCSTTGYSRKYLIALINTDDKPRKKRKRGPKTGITDECARALIVVWEIANCICSKRLVMLIPEICSNLRANGHQLFSQDVELQLCSISAATIDRVLRPERIKRKRSLSHTKRASTVKNKVPIRTFAEWEDVKPGFFEIDTVSHSSSNANGPFLDSLNMTDIATCWTIPIAIRRKSAADVLRALRKSHELIPFPILGLDFDNGSEFLNDLVIDWCAEKRITCTRSRPRKKNDQAWIEEKNNSVVRKNVGRSRYSSDEAFAVLNGIYSVLAVYFNFFQPCQKLLEKKRDGAKVYKKHDRPKTPYQRVLESSHISPIVKDRLKSQKEKLDILKLSRELMQLRDQLQLLAEDVPNPILAVMQAQRNALQKFVSKNLEPVQKRKAPSKPKSESLPSKVTSLILGLPAGTELSAPTFSHLASGRHLNKCLHMLTKRGFLEHAHQRGVYLTTAKTLEPKHSIAKDICGLIETMDYYEPLTASTFRDIANSTVACTTLHKLAKKGIVKRVERGVFLRVNQEATPKNNLNG